MRTQIIRQKINKSYVTHWVEEKKELDINLEDKIRDWKRKKELEAIKNGRDDWKIYIEWMWWVSL